MIPTHRRGQDCGRGDQGAKGKVDGFAVRVPTPTVSMVDFISVLGRETTAAEQ